MARPSLCTDPLAGPCGTDSAHPVEYVPASFWPRLMTGWATSERSAGHLDSCLDSRSALHPFTINLPPPPHCALL